MFKVRVVTQAGFDIKDACDWTAIHSSADQSRKLRRIFREAIESLRVFPERGRPGRMPGTRELVLGEVPFFIVYQVERRQVIILSVQHQARASPPP